jgi:tRNA threonylcarbamoyladenosine biosynthesis protein TsaB
MTLLAIDTTGPRAEVAVVGDEETLAVDAFEHRMDLARLLMPRVDAVLTRAGVALQSLAGIVVSLGPGSYTGIRIGVVTAKALAYAGGLPLAGVPTLEALAAEADAATPSGADAGVGVPAPLPGAERLICALIPARADEYYAALYQRADGGLRPRAAASVMRLEALVERLVRYPGRVLVAGDAPEAASRLASALGPRLLQREGAARGLARWVAALGRPRLATGGDDPATLAPLYVRAPTVTLPDGRVTEV